MSERDNADGSPTLVDRPGPADDFAEERPSRRAVRALREGELLAERYQIVRALAEGGMGEVYVALDLELDEQVALKTILPELAADRRQTSGSRASISSAIPAGSRRSTSGCSPTDRALPRADRCEPLGRPLADVRLVGLLGLHPPERAAHRTVVTPRLDRPFETDQVGLEIGHQ